MARSLSQLLAETWDIFRRKFTILLAGAAITALLLAVTQSFYLTHVDGMWQALQTSEDQHAFLEGAVPPWVEEMVNGNLSDEQRIALAFFFLILPASVGFLLVAFLLSFVAAVYFTLFAIHADEPNMTFAKVASRVPRWILPFFALSIWVFLRSFTWIPLIGFVAAFIIVPRLIASVVILVREETGVIASARESYRRTKGYWGKIVGNTIVASFLVGIASSFAGWIAAAISWIFLSFLFALFLDWLVSMLAYGFSAIFAVKLAETILAHPRGTPAALATPPQQAASQGQGGAQ